jgi:Cys-rich protein (TIGR01571 family)
LCLCVLKKYREPPTLPKIKKITKKANASHTIFLPPIKSMENNLPPIKSSNTNGVADSFRKRACATKIHGCRTPFPTRTSVVFAPAGSNPPHLTENKSTHLSRHASSSVMATAFTNQYSENLFGCFDDCGICVYGYFCTPCLVGQSVEEAGQGKCYDTAYQIICCMSIPYVGPFLAAQKIGEAINKVRSQLFTTSRLFETFPPFLPRHFSSLQHHFDPLQVDFDTLNVPIPFL